MRPLLALCVALAAGAASAQSVALHGMLGNKALLIVDGSAPKTVAPGESYKGVTVLSTLGDEAVVEVAGQRQTLRIGEAPASVGGGAAPARSGKIVLTAGTGGHFLASGAINGRAVQFMVDTGATTVALGTVDAERLGIDYRKGQLTRSGTANGIVSAHLVKLNAVRVGEVEVYDVEALVLPAHTGPLLLGNSFLSRFQMTRFNDQLVLERRY
ncbi:MAG TPA: TIGR02281 family clan AA aspartic protease [Ramlibacter sp.]|uniref:retropepsin-like aspartic protease family protein n=1 Tax=Ramlibacter sp. TaxID=1917967 RepID=UPI002D8115AA|nr:TIGR02281 family clan AA aspartic protease [Ramlibacter sp.]HET8748693.1 TIGR02281 family clan AA aspartic protease [Ramlibacter sp.]